MPRGRIPFSASILGDADCVRHAALEGIISVNQEYAVIRIDICIRLERFVFAVKHLHPGVRHRTAGRDFVVAVGSTQAVPWQPPMYAARAPRSHRRSPVRGASRTRAPPGLCAARVMRFALVAIRVWWLMVSRIMVSTNCAWIIGPATVYERFAGEYGRALGYGPYVAFKLKIAKIIEECLREALAAAKICNILLGKMQVFEVFNQLFHACHDGISAAVRYTAEEHIEVCAAVADTLFRSIRSPS